MKSRQNRKCYYCLLFNCLVLISLNSFAQEIVKPLHNAILLSGNFGELRATHFHSGIDFRTGGVEGLPVMCVKDGKLVRVSVSPIGYGQALYIEHPDGTTTVYGHLQRFTPSIEGMVRDIQYQKESFQIDEKVGAYDLSFRKGDTIAYSGNTGASGGPHLHFEVRTTQTENALNPLHYYTIRDNQPPVVRRIYLYSIAKNGQVEILRQCPVKTIAPGKYTVERVVVPAGKIGIGVFAVDYMNGSSNKLGIYKMELTSGKDTLFRFSLDSCAFNQSRLINEIKDFDLYKRNETVYHCFGLHQERLMGVANQNKGCIEIAKDSIRRVSLSLMDINGNRSRVSLELKGGLPKKTEGEEKDFLTYNQAHTLNLPGCEVIIDEGALFSTIKKIARVEKDSLRKRNVFVLSEKDIPLLKKAHLRLSGNHPSHSLICEVGSGGKLFPVETRKTDQGLTAEIGYLGRYCVVEDRDAPSIVCLGKFPDRTFRFKIQDNLSGVATYRGEVNGQWCLFSYDPKTSLLQCNLMEPVFDRKRINEVKIFVEDKAGNKSEVVVKI